MKVAVAVVLVIVFLASFAMATLTFEEAESRLAQIQQLKELLADEEASLKAESFVTRNYLFKNCI